MYHKIDSNLKANEGHIFDNYVDSVEIKVYCKETERETMEKMKEK